MKRMFPLPYVSLLFFVLILSGGCAQEGLYSKATELSFLPGFGIQFKISPVILGFDGSDIASDIALDPKGNIIIAGQTTSDPFDTIPNKGSTDAFISKQNPDGTRAWTVLLDGALYDYATDVTTDTAGNIYVCGTTTSNLEGELNAGSQDAFLVKLDPAGNILATRLVGDGGADRGRSITVDSTGNIYIVGYTSSNPFYTFPTAGTDAFITKFDSGLNKEWSYVFEGGGDDQARDIICDPGNFIYVAGITGSDPFEGTAVGSPGTNSWVMKIDPATVPPMPPPIHPPYIARDWMVFLNGDTIDEVNALALGGANDVYVTGRTSSVNFNGFAKPGASYDGFIVKLDNAAMGTALWTEFLSGDSNDYPEDIAVDPDGNSYVTGTTYSEDFDSEDTLGSSCDAFTTMRDLSGNKVWTSVLVYDANDFGTGIVLDNWNYVYISGYTTSVIFDGEDTSMPADEAFIYKYNPSGAKH